MKKHPIRPLLPIAALLMAPAVMAQAQAPETNNAFQLRAGLGVEHDSNVLRSSSNAQSDTVANALVGLKFDRRYSLQRLRADVEADTYRYRNLSDQNYTTLNYNAAWDWSFTPKLHGTLSADRKQYRDTSTISPASGPSPVGRRTERTELAEGIYELGAAWRALAGVSHSSVKSTVPTYDGSPTVRSSYVGAGYELASGSSITGRFRHGNGEYADATAAPGGFRENEADVLVKWPVTAKTSLEGRIGHLRRTHSSNPARDFSGFVGDATVLWEITGKTRLLAQVAHDLSASGFDPNAGGHVETNRLLLKPTWNATAQTSVNLTYEYLRRSWQDVLPAGSPDVGRHEHVQRAGIGLDWSPRPKITVSASIRNERLSSSVFNVGYRDTIYGVAGKFYF